MQKDISTKQMYKILNEAIKECFNDNDIPVNTAMSIFRERHWQATKQHLELNMFSDPVPPMVEVAKADDFCSLLDEYRISVDVYNDNNEELSVEKYRQIYEGINYFRPHISEEAEQNFSILENNIKSHLPEFANDAILSNYTQKACYIAGIKKQAQRDKNNKERLTQTYQHFAQELFNEIASKNNILSIPTSPKKIQTYASLLNIVDCLPNEQYKRVEKFRLKRNINRAIFQMCTDLGDNYYGAKKKAEMEIIKYDKAIKNAKKHAKKGNKSLSELRNLRMLDEYLYK